MKFERFAHVPQEDINKCIKETKAKLSDKTLVKAYEDSWDPLQQFYREKELKALKWKNLEVEQHNYTPDDCCLLSSEELKDMKQPVLLRGTLYDLKTLGPKIENHSIFPERTNVTFAQILDKKNIKVNVWERGAGQTKACGTAACAVAVSASEKGLADKSSSIHFVEGKLQIDYGEEILMTGPVSEVKRINLDI